MATYDELARNYASSAKTEYENSLGYLTDDIRAQQNLDQQALQQRYDNLLAQINRQIDPINQQYNEDAQAAYINKMMANRYLDTTLNQLGVNSQGFGVNQRLQNENAYSQNLAALQRSRDEGLRDVSNQAADTMGDYNVAATQLDSDYLGKLAAMKQYVQEQGQKYYDTQYANYLGDLKYQDDMRKYNDAMAQQNWENQFKERQLAEEIRQANLNYSYKVNNSGGSSAKQQTSLPEGYNLVAVTDNTVRLKKPDGNYATYTFAKDTSDTKQKELLINWLNRQGVGAATAKDYINSVF